MKYPISDREQLQTILKYYLNTKDTDIGSFTQNLTEDIREYMFTITPNPTNALDLDANAIKCSITLDRQIGVYYCMLGTYKEVIDEYLYKNMKETYFRRKFLYDNYRKSDAIVDKLIQFTYDSMMNKKAEASRDLRPEPMDEMEDEVAVGAAEPAREYMAENLNQSLNELSRPIRDIVTERQDIPYDAMGTYEGPNEDRG